MDKLNLNFDLRYVLLTYCFKTLFYCSCSNGNICHFHEYMMTFLSMRKCAKTWESMARYDKKRKVCKNKRKREKLCPKVYTKWNKVKWELSMPKYSRVCNSILKYTIVCKRMRRYAKACKNSQKFVKVFKSIHKNAYVCKSLWRYMKVLRKYAKVCLQLRECALE